MDLNDLVVIAPVVLILLYMVYLDCFKKYDPERTISEEELESKSS